MLDRGSEQHSGTVLVSFDHFQRSSRTVDELVDGYPPVYPPVKNEPGAGSSPINTGSALLSAEGQSHGDS